MAPLHKHTGRLLARWAITGAADYASSVDNRAPSRRYDRYFTVRAMAGFACRIVVMLPGLVCAEDGSWSLVSIAARQDAWSRRSSLRPRTLSRSPGVTSSRTSRRGAQQSTPFCSLWHPVATAGMGASVSRRHERLAALLMPTSSGNTLALPSKRRIALTGSCRTRRGSSTTRTVGSADSPPASPPTPPGGRGP
jgi:hypothetical protein